MKGDVIEFLDFMDGSKKCFIIPVYQRNYSWKIKQCEQMFNDLKELILKKEITHFFGSIVSSRMDGGNKEDYLIIDGQQRLTTVSILLIAIVNLLKSGQVQSENESLSDEILETHLVSKHKKENRKILLKPIKQDCQAFDALFEPEEYFIESSNVTANYKYFLDRIINEKINIDELYEAISRLKTIDIFLEKDDDPQLIFESLNSTGLALEEGDKIRNFILMGLSPAMQEKYYENYWNKIEQKTDHKVSDFFKDYLTLKLNKTVVIKDIYFTFKDYVTKKKEPVEVLLEDLLSYAKLYSVILNPLQSNESFSKVLNRLGQLEVTVTYPFLLAVLNRWANKYLESADVYEIFSVIETFLFRRLIVGLPTHSLSKIFSTLEKDVNKRIESDGRSYKEIFKYVLLNKEQNMRFPNDEEFEQALFSKNIYAMNSKNKMYLFSFLENQNSKEQVEVIAKMKDGTYSIEHVMPQKLSSKWKADLGENYQQIHELWLHTLANLTLTGYNGNYSNFPFSDKLNMENGFKTSNLRLNQYIRDCHKWGEAELIERKKLLSIKSLELWPLPTSNYIAPEKETDEYLLDDDFDFTYCLVQSYIFFGVESKVSSWKEMLVGIVKYLIIHYPAAIKTMSEDTKFYELSLEKTSNSFIEVSKNLYLYAECSTKAKIISLKKMFEKCEIDPTELSICILKKSVDMNDSAGLEGA